MDLPPLLVVLLLGLATVLVAFAVVLTPRPGPQAGVNRGTRFFLVMLRLAIGWHFLFEGLDKWRNPAWSSEAYLREASGPCASVFHGLAGDRLKDRLTVGDNNTFPDRLGLEWDVYFQRFTSNYSLTKKQLDQAQTRFKQAQDRTLRFLTQDKRSVRVPSNVPPALEVDLTVPERIAMYEKKLARARELEETEVPVDRDAGWAKVREAKRQANIIRADLQKHLDEQTRTMMDMLAEVVRPTKFLEGEDDKEKVDDRLKERMKVEWDGYLEWFVDYYELSEEKKEEAKTKLAEASQATLKYLAAGKRTVHDLKEQSLQMRRQLDSILTPAQRDKQEKPPAAVAVLPLSYLPSWSRLDWADFLVKYGLLVIGALLILGLLTRTACVAGALFLLSFFLAMPPLPWLDANPRAEGHYVYLNKNIIEMLALLALAWTRSGRWAGLDGLLQLFRPRAWRESPRRLRPGPEIPPVVAAPRTFAKPEPRGAAVTAVSPD
jgi:uncharacterized membrane protein YphA (DoxX/SURF4 family)